jgi:hypothetical protein
MIVHSKCLFRIHKANANPGTGLVMQLTSVEHNGIRAFVRENIHYDRFYTNSTVRYAMSHGKVSAKDVQNVLELCAPAEHWHEIAAEVRRLDSLKRPVLVNRLFTQRWAERTFAAASDEFFCLAG